MAANGQNRWVVLLNKSPKGPLTESEVKTLLGQGLLRLNDVAYQVKSDEPKTNSEWKLLWQFPEFNRRQAEPSAPTPKKTVPSEGEDRRKAKDPDEIKKSALSELPPDLLEITPEDLIPKSTAVSFGPEPERLGSLSDPSSLREPSDKVPPFDMRWVYSGAGVLITSFVAVNWVGSTKPPTASSNENHHSGEPGRTPNQISETGPTSRPRAPGPGPEASANSAPIPTPAPVLGRPLPEASQASSADAPEETPEGSVVDSSDLSNDVMRPGEAGDEDEAARPGVLTPGVPVEPAADRRSLRRRPSSVGDEGADGDSAADRYEAGDTEEGGRN